MPSKPQSLFFITLNHQESMSKPKNHSSQWIHITLLLTIISLSLSPLSCAAKHRKGGGGGGGDDDDHGVSYSAHCKSVPPKSTAQQEQVLDNDVLALPRYPSAHVSGGAPFLNHSSAMPKVTVLFRRFRAYETVRDDVFKVEVTLILRQKLNDDFYYGYGNYSYDSEYGQSSESKRRARRGVLKFKLSGYMYQETGVLCMVGHGNGFSRKGDMMDDIPAVFRVYNLKKKSSIDTSLITATLDSLSSVGGSGYFEQISLMMFTEIGYEYSMVLTEKGNGGFDRADDGSKSLPLPSQQEDAFCSIFNSYYQFELAYPSGCDYDKNCSPFGRSTIGNLSRGLMLTSIECDSLDHKLRLLVKFYGAGYDYDYSTGFDPKTTLIGEGVWDKKKNKLHIVACKILSFTGSSNDARVGNCSIRLSLRFPATGSIRDISYIKGNIWSRKPNNESDYFNEIEFKTSQNQGNGIGGLKYEYTLLDSVRKSCPPLRIKNKGTKDRYPDSDSYMVSFDILAKTPDGNISSGYSTPLYVGDHIFEQNGYAINATAPSSEMATPIYPVEKNLTLQVPVNVSYAINLQETSYLAYLGPNDPQYNISLYQPKYTQISAEGIYDPRTGGLCMIGCKKLGPESQVTTERGLDCEIVINFQFPTLKGGDGFIKGSIESTRKVNDPLHFERLELTSSAFISSVALENIWRMDFEIILVLISNTLACVFIAFQLFYVKRRPQTLPFASLIMLAILTLSYMMPLLLNFEALFMPNHNRQDVSLQSGRWIDVNEVLVRVITMVAFLLQFRLLQLTWSSRVGEKMNIWAPEIKGLLFVLLPIYFVGALVTCVLNWQQDQQQLLGGLKSYAGLVLDGFLLPQILLNIFGNTKEKTLSVAYYTGTTFVRLLPHAYDIFRSNSYESAVKFESSYIYANHGTDFFSIAWDVTIPCMALVFAAIIFLQQRFGGHVVVPRRFRDGEDYEKVPVVPRRFRDGEDYEKVPVVPRRFRDGEDYEKVPVVPRRFRDGEDYEKVPVVSYDL